MPDLMIEDLTKNYESKVAVNHISMNIRSGHFVAFLGPNGAGKSTTVSMLTGLSRPTSGTIRFGSSQPNDSRYKQLFGVVFQNSTLDLELSVQQNLDLRAKMYPKIDHAWISRLIEDFSLADILKQKYGTLSGGQRRRVDIARALIHHPQILILDEPSTGLDIQTRNIIWQTLLKLRQSFGITMILTTHYLEEAEAADYVYIIDHGEIIAEDSIGQLKSKYAQYQLNLQTDDMKQLILTVNQKELTYQQPNSQSINVCVKNAQEALKVLNAVQPYITSFESREGNLNDIFMTLTGKEIR